MLCSLDMFYILSAKAMSLNPLILLLLLPRDIITDVKKNQANSWWSGTLHGRTGVFPSAFVEDYEGDIPLAASLSSKETRKSRDSVTYAEPKPVKATRRPTVNSLFSHICYYHHFSVPTLGC